MQGAPTRLPSFGTCQKVCTHVHLQAKQSIVKHGSHPEPQLCQCFEADLSIAYACPGGQVLACQNLAGIGPRLQVSADTRQAE